MMIALFEVEPWEWQTFAVVITPHGALNTRESEPRILDTTHENIRSFITGEPASLVR